MGLRLFLLLYVSNVARGEHPQQVGVTDLSCRLAYHSACLSIHLILSLCLKLFGVFPLVLSCFNCCEDCFASTFHMPISLSRTSYGRQARLF